MEIEKIIKKMEKDVERQMKKGKDARGSYGIIETWYEEMQNCNDDKILDEYYHKIYGMLYGLYGTYFITKTELDKAKKELLSIWKATNKKIFDAEKGESL